MRTQTAKLCALLLPLLFTSLAKAQTQVLPKGVTVDPVCGSLVSEWASYAWIYKGVYFDFDSHECRETFKANPVKYLTGPRVHIVNIVDPVCGARVDLSRSYDLKHDGRVYHFHTLACREIFKANPAGYLKSAGVAMVP